MWWKISLDYFPSLFEFRRFDDAFEYSVCIRVGSCEGRTLLLNTFENKKKETYPARWRTFVQFSTDSWTSSWFISGVHSFICSRTALHWCFISYMWSGDVAPSLLLRLFPSSRFSKMLSILLILLPISLLTLFDNFEGNGDDIFYLFTFFSISLLLGWWKRYFFIMRYCRNVVFSWGCCVCNFFLLVRVKERRGCVYGAVYMRSLMTSLKYKATQQTQPQTTPVYIPPYAHTTTTHKKI